MTKDDEMIVENDDEMMVENDDEMMNDVQNASAAHEQMNYTFHFLFQAYEEAGIQVQTVSKILPPSHPSQSSTSSAEVTLNALNAAESEVESEGLSEFGNGPQVR